MPEDRSAQPTVRYVRRPFEGVEVSYRRYSINFAMPEFAFEVPSWADARTWLDQESTYQVLFKFYSSSIPALFWSMKTHFDLGVCWHQVSGSY